MVLVDNSPFCSVPSIHTANQKIQFYPNKHDREMRDLTKYLKSLVEYDDMRVKNARVFKLRQLFNGLNLVQNGVVSLNESKSSIFKRLFNK
jgi:hypothetical protein